MKQLLLVFLGGGAGSALRFLISKNLNQIITLPVGTLLVNVLGSLLIGLFLGLGMRQDLLSSNTTLFLATGFAGGFTTFSTFSYENQVFLKAGDFWNFGVYTVLSLVLGLAAVFVGLWVGKGW